MEVKIGFVGEGHIYVIRMHQRRKWKIVILFETKGSPVPALSALNTLSLGLN